MRIQHNILAMNSYRNYTNNTNALGKNLEKLSSGYKINRAGDDAAGLAISEKMRAQIQGLSAAQKNVKDAISFVKTAEGAMQEIQDMLSRMKYLATQSANGTYQDKVDREALQDEVDSLLEEIDRIADSANFNGIYMLNGGAGNKEDPEDPENPGGPDGGSIVTANAAVGAAMKPGTEKTTGNKASVTVDAKLKDLDFKSSDAITKSADGGTITVKTKEGVEFKVKIVVASKAEGEPKLDGGTATLTVASSAKLKDVFEQIQSALTAAVNNWNDNKASGNDPFTGYENVQLSLKESGNTIDGATYGTVKYVAGSDDKKTAAVPKDKTFDIDLSGVEGKFKDGEKVKIGNTWFKFVKSTDDTNTDNSESTASMAAYGLQPALSGQGTEGDPYQVDLDEDFDKAMDNLAKAITEKKDDLGISATYKDGKLTIKAEKDFETEEDFKKAMDIKFDEGSDVGKQIKDAWDKAVEEALGGGGGSYTIKMQIGDSSDTFDQMELKIKSMKTDSLGVSGLKINTIDTAHNAIDTIMKAINTVSSTRGKLGAYQNRLEHTQNNLSVMTENIQDAESTIRDTDVADEMMGYVKNNILVQSAQAMLAQANQVPQGVLQLLG